jgi:hypothetical protein
LPAVLKVHPSLSELIVTLPVCSPNNGVWETYSFSMMGFNTAGSSATLTL